MELISLLYLSKSAMSAEVAEGEVEKIVALANRHNVAVDITGALLFTGSDFAQVLEGYAPDVDALMESIGRDVRHRDVIVIDRRPIVVRRFLEWSMAYAGPSPFVAGFVSRLQQAPRGTALDEAVGALEELMSAFARQ